jgi:hypothetical protein
MAWIKNTPENKPEEGKYVLVTIILGKVIIACYLKANGRLYWKSQDHNQCSDHYILAWQPLPEPYKE